MLLAGTLLIAAEAGAHPLPNSLVTIRTGFGRMRIVVDTPAPDLAIAMAVDEGGTGRSGGQSLAMRIGRYYLRHVVLTDVAGKRLPVGIVSTRLIDAIDPDVGRYREWRTELSVDARAGAAGGYRLSYDAVIHQIPNHVAIVRAVDAEPSAEGDRSPSGFGVIRYDFASASIPPLALDISAGGLASGTWAMIAVGFAHVLSGLDHVLFLAALLMVAPFEVAGGRWRFRGMNRRALRRFVAVSLAFTLGHSVSLAAGSFGFDPLPTRWTEVLVAVSIVAAALHALRPLFPSREWQIAAGFGLIHGLAFSQTLVALDLDVRSRLAALFGFNLGVEAGQLAVMALAFPLLAISGGKMLLPLRQLALVLVIALATAWAGQRAFDLTLPDWLTI